MVPCPVVVVGATSGRDSNSVNNTDDLRIGDEGPSVKVIIKIIVI